MSVDQWASVRPYFPANPPAGLGVDDQARVMAYDVYENFYWSDPAVFKIEPRSTDAKPIYLPSSRSIIEASARFLAVDWDFLVNPRVGTPDDQNLVKGLLQGIWKRELMYSKFVSQKRNALIRGECLWHVTADPSKVLGERISIHELHPGEYFPIHDLLNPDRIIGCYIVDEVPDPRDPLTKVLSRRQGYRKDDVTGVITSTLELYELAKWDDRVKLEDATKVQDVRPPLALPDTITSLPVYHIKNFRTNTIWGSSELRGIETVMAALNGGASDQDLAIALQGLGVYWTDAGPPKNSDGTDGAFVMGPGEVVEVPSGTQFGRVSGISASLPGIEHMDFIMKAATEAVAVPDVARGKVDVAIAESGISLRMQMAPMLAKNAEKEMEMLGVYDHMMYDLTNQWLKTYEQVPTATLVEVATVVGDPLPQNRDAVIAELLTLITSVPPLITIGMAQAKLAELGYEFPADAQDQVFKDAQAITDARANIDPFANRFKEEVENVTGVGAGIPSNPTPTNPAGAANNGATVPAGG